MATHDHDRHPHQGPSKTKVLAIMALLPMGGALLGLASITLAGTMIGLVATIPLFVILISPILILAVLTFGLATAGLLTAGTFGLMGPRQVTGMWRVDLVKRRFQNVVEFMGQKTKDAGQEIGPEGQVHSARV